MIGKTSKVTLLFTIALLFFIILPAFAQSESNAYITAFNSEAFPLIQLNFRIFNSDGNFIQGLTLQDIAIIEDGEAAIPLELNRQQSGARIIFAFNLGPSFAIRDSNGVSRMDILMEQLQTWSQSYIANPNDEFHLISNVGYEQTGLHTTSELTQALQGLQTDARESQPTLDVLSRALDIALSTPPHPEMGNAIILITPPADQQAASVLPNLTDIALQSHTRLYTWMIASQDLFETAGANLLQQASFETGGSYFAFSGVEPFPPLEAYFEPLRYFYTLTYRSMINASGTHTSNVTINWQDVPITLPTISFNINIEPPNPIFVSPPLTIERNYTQVTQDTLSPMDLMPQTQPIEIIVEFPDGHPRLIRRTALIVDGVIVAENKSEPFEFFDWDLTPYLTSGEHTLQVEAEDELGLVKRSLPTTVEITIHHTPRSILNIILNRLPLLIASLSIVALGIIFFLLIARGKIRPRAFGSQRRKTVPVPRENTTSPAPQHTTSIEEPEPREHSTPGRGPWIQWLTRRQHKAETSTSKESLAFLEPQPNLDGKRHATTISLGFEEVILGKDPQSATIVLKDPSLRPAHAKITPDKEGNHWIFDLNTISGTLVNHQHVPDEGRKLSHGDLIFIGRTCFRYKRANIKNLPAPKVITLEDED